MAIPISADERKWRAQDDARTLAQANVIKQDQQRLAAAKAEARRMAEEQAKEAAAMRGVAGKAAQAPKQQAKKPVPAKRGSRRRANAKNTAGGTGHNVFTRLGSK